MRGFVIGALLGASLTLVTLHALSAPVSQRFPQFQNSAVKVWRTSIPPGAHTEMHRHDHARVVVALTSGTLTLIDAQGQRELHTWEAGKAYWLTAMPLGTMHADVNAGSTSIEVMMIELQND